MTPETRRIVVGKLIAIQAQCAGHADEFSLRVAELAGEALAILDAEQPAPDEVATARARELATGVAQAVSWSEIRNTVKRDAHAESISTGRGEQPAQTCETCEGSREVHFRTVKNADGVVTDTERMPCPDCRPTCETCGDDGLDHDCDENCHHEPGAERCPDCAGEEG